MADDGDVHWIAIDSAPTDHTAQYPKEPWVEIPQAWPQPIVATAGTDAMDNGYATGNHRTANHHHQSQDNLLNSLISRRATITSTVPFYGGSEEVPTHEKLATASQRDNFVKRSQEVEGQLETGALALESPMSSCKRVRIGGPELGNDRGEPGERHY